MYLIGNTLKVLYYTNIQVRVFFILDPILNSSLSQQKSGVTGSVTMTQALLHHLLFVLY